MTYLVDMDGVLCNFVRGIEEKYNVDLSGLDTYDLVGYLGMDFWHEVDNDLYFWTSLKPIRMGMRLIHQLPLEETLICTSSPSAIALLGKSKWLHRNLPQYLLRCCFVRNKTLLAGPKAVLIDDFPETIDAFNAAGGHGVLFPAQYNKGEKDETRLLAAIRAI